MTNNDSTVSLKISSVAKSDAGLYFCGFYTSGNLTLNVVRLDVKGKSVLSLVLSFFVVYVYSIFPKLSSHNTNKRGY